MIEQKTVELITDIANHLIDQDIKEGNLNVCYPTRPDNFTTKYVLQAALVYVRAEKLARRKDAENLRSAPIRKADSVRAKRAGGERSKGGNDRSPVDDEGVEPDDSESLSLRAQRVGQIS